MRKKFGKRFIGLAIDNIGVIIMFIIIILVFLQVIARYVFKNPLSWSEEVARCFLIWLVMVGAAMASRDKEHLKIEGFVHLVSSKYQKLFYLFSDLIIIFVSSVILIYGYSFAMLNWSQYLPSMSWLSIFWICLSIPISSGLILIYAIEDFLKKVNLLK